MTPERCGPDDPRLSEVLTLIRTSFADMEGRIDPPSSMHRLTVEAVTAQARDAEVWVCGDPVVACVFLTPDTTELYIGKLAVDAQHRGAGLARRLIELAEQRAQARGLLALRLQTRVELVENHKIFKALGFYKSGETSHEGYDRPTSITMHKEIADL